MTYTAFSRVSEDGNWCLAEGIPFDRIEHLNRHPQKKLRKAEEKRLKQLSETLVDDNKCTVLEYLQLLHEIDVFSDDDIHDTLCPKFPDKCSYIYHSQI